MPALNEDPAQTHHSVLREKLLEHLFLSELLRALWRQGLRDMEVLRAEVDGAGYDLVVECNGVLRHIQLKSSHASAKTDSVNIHSALAGKPGGCVVWLWFDATSLAFTRFLWLGGRPGKPITLGTKIARHSKGNREGQKAFRPNIREVRKSLFTPLSSIEGVSDRLFGDRDSPYASTAALGGDEATHLAPVPGPAL